MRPHDVAVSRQGNLAVINHNKFEIKFNLSKGTWDYIDESGNTIIRNGCTQVTLDDGTVIKTEDTGTREFITELPKTDAFGDYQQVRFSHEATGKGIRINTYLNCYSDQPAIHLKVGVENLKPEPLQLDSVTVLGVSENRGAVLIGTTPSECHLFINMPPVSPGVSKRLYDGFLLSETDAMHPSHDGVLHDTQTGKALVFGFLTTENGGPGFRSVVNRMVENVHNPVLKRKKHQYQALTRGHSIISVRSTATLVKKFSLKLFISTLRLVPQAAYEHYTALRAKKNQQANGQSTTAHNESFAAWSFSDTSGPLDPDAVLTQADALAEHPLFQPNAPGGSVIFNLTQPQDYKIQRLSTRFKQKVLRQDSKLICSGSHLIQNLYRTIQTIAYRSNLQLAAEGDTHGDARHRTPPNPQQSICQTPAKRSHSWMSPIQKYRHGFVNRLNT